MHTINNGPCMNKPTHECMTPGNVTDSNQINKKANSEQVTSDKRRVENRDNEDKSKGSAGCIITRFGRMIKRARHTCI